MDKAETVVETALAAPKVGLLSHELRRSDGYIFRATALDGYLALTADYDILIAAAEYYRRFPDLAVMEISAKDLLGQLNRPDNEQARGELEAAIARLCKTFVEESMTIDKRGGEMPQGAYRLLASAIYEHDDGGILERVTLELSPVLADMAREKEDGEYINAIPPLHQLHQP